MELLNGVSILQTDVFIPDKSVLLKALRFGLSPFFFNSSFAIPVKSAANIHWSLPPT